MGKTIMILVIAAAFVAGSMMTGTMAYGAGDKNGKPFEALWTAIHDIQTQIDSITTGVVDWLDITGIPADIADGDDDTQLSEVEVEGFITNNAINLFTGSTLDGVALSTGSHTVDSDTNAETICGTGQLLDGDGNCQTIPTGAGVTVNHAFVLGAIIFNPPAGTVLMSDTFVSSSTSIVHVTAVLNAFSPNTSTTVTFADVSLRVDGVQVARSFERIPEFPKNNGENNLTWVGSLPSGTHTIDVVTNTLNAANLCGAGPGCQMSILRFE